LLREVVPDLIERFDVANAKLLDRSFLLEDWRGRESDLLFEIPFHSADGDLPVLVVVLLEHQSRPDALMPLRMLLYAVLFWERQWKEYETDHPTGESLKLTPILPIVFHTGKGRWTTNRTLAELIGGPEALRKFIPAWNILFWDLADRAPQDLLNAAGEFMQTLAIVRVDHENRETYRTVYVDALRRLEPLSDRDKMRWRDLVMFLLSWGGQRRTKDEFQDLLDAATASQSDVAHRKEMNAMSSTAGQTWAQAMKEEGALRNCREILRAILEDQFGPLPDALVRRIEAASDLDRLKASVRQAARIAKLEDLQI
jgi:hypothetical protein